jgi:phage terminase large subunit-like protein
MRKALESKQVLRPELWSKKALRERRDIIGTARFLQEFMHVPISRKNRVIKEHWIRYYQQLPKRFDKIVMGIDVATTEKTRSDYTAVCFIGVSK